MAEQITQPVDLAREGRLLWCYCLACQHEREVDPLSLGIDPAEPVPTVGKRLKLSRCGSRETRQNRSYTLSRSMPDESWKGSGTCTWNLKNGDKQHETWDEGSHLKEYPFKWTGGTGKYEGAKGGGTYIYENLTDTLSAGTYKGKMELP